jgi:hypothetical protein
MSNLNCAVCGSPNVTKTIDAESGLAALCNLHYSLVVDEAAKVESSERAARRIKAKEAGL